MWASELVVSCELGMWVAAQPGVSVVGKQVAAVLPEEDWQSVVGYYAAGDVAGVAAASAVVRSSVIPPAAFEVEQFLASVAVGFPPALMDVVMFGLCGPK